MIIERITIEEAKTKAASYEAVIGNTISNVIVGSVSQIPDIDWEQILDLRFFSSTGEIHVFRDGELKAIEFTGDYEDDYYDRTVEIDKSVPGCESYSWLEIREYYTYDIDGQIEIKYIKPVKLV